MARALLKEEIYSNNTAPEEQDPGEDIELHDVPHPHLQFENRYTFHNVLELPPPLPIKGGGHFQGVRYAHL